MVEVIMPKMGDGMEEGTLVEWLKKDGEKVKSGEVIGSIQTDKATLELEAPGSGILTGFLIQEGDTVPVGQPIALILRSGESIPQGWGTGKTTPIEEVAPQTNGSATAPLEEISTKVDASTDRTKASPLAKKIAREHGIDIIQVQGSGPGGRIVERDVQAALTKQPSSGPVLTPAVTGEDRTIKLSKLRQITAQRTAQSKQQVPHFYVTVAVDVESILQLRSQFEHDASGKVSINDFVLRACVLALRDMPEVNAVYNGDSLTQYGAIHIGMAVAIPDGLTVPVIKNAHAMTLRELATRSRELAQKSRENKLTPDELQGSTLSVSNMGMLNVDNFIAIINQPNAAILAVSSVKKQVVADENGDIVVRSRMNITLSFDHRVVDGAIGAKFTNIIREYLENPTRLLS